MISTAALQHKWNSKTKPPGSLGVLEQIAIQAGVIWQTESPKITRPHLVVFAGDHGIAATGLVNPYPQSVTAQMVLNFIHGGAAINVLCRQHGITLEVADAGVNYSFDVNLPIQHLKVGFGTRNYLDGPAMSLQEVEYAWEQGRRMVKAIRKTGCNLIGFGEMGIGNSSSAALIMHHLTGLPLDACTGIGTGTPPQLYQTKLDTLEKVALLHRLSENKFSTHTLLSKVGGYEITMMCGAYLEAYAQQMIIVVDGFIATASLLCAYEEEKKILEHCLFSHVSGEKGHQAMLDFLQVSPLLQLGMRLGEGTGVAMAMPIIKSALCLFEEMATFEGAAISKNNRI